MFFLLRYHTPANSQAIELVSVGKGVLLGEESCSASVFSSFLLFFFFQYFLYLGCFLDSDKPLHAWVYINMVWFQFTIPWMNLIDILKTTR